MSHQYVVTFIGDDRTGIVGQLSEAIAKHGGNWLESQLSQLGGKFAGLILVAFDSDAAAEALQSELAAMPGGNWSVRVTAAGARSTGGDANLSLSVVGPDRTGIVREVSSALAQVGINVISMETTVESAAFTGEPMFRATISAHAPDDVESADLEQRLDDVANAMTLDIDLS